MKATRRSPPPSASWEAHLHSASVATSLPVNHWNAKNVSKNSADNELHLPVFILAGNLKFFLLEMNLTWQLMSTLKGSIANACNQWAWMLVVEETNHNLKWEKLWTVCHMWPINLPYVACRTWGNDINCKSSNSCQCYNGNFNRDLINKFPPNQSWTTKTLHPAALPPSVKLRNLLWPMGEKVVQRNKTPCWCVYNLQHLMTFDAKCLTIQLKLCSSATGRVSLWLRACLIAPILPDFHFSHVLTVSYHVAGCVPS